jgi:GT2 family glycosyltransferase
MSFIPYYSFAAFIITRNRPDTLISTISTVLSQTLPPECILIVDNSDCDDTRKRILTLNNEKLLYHSVGYNAGPAGGAYWGLKLLFEKGYDWVIWIDDDDPPKFEDVFEKMFQIVDDNESPVLGMVGSVGERFDFQKAKILRLNDHELTGYLDVDNISGNMFPLVSKRVFEKGILPSKDFFFGFEDLGFSLAVKRGGFRIMISGELHYEHRKLANRFNLKKKQHHQRSPDSLWREYYSVRSITYILLHQEKKKLAAFISVFRNLCKSVLVFRYGFIYGNVVSIMIIRGLFDGIIGRLGMRITPLNKPLAS